jgi:transglutaminase-like putative cysteine protease
VSGLLFLAIPRFQLENSLFLERFITRKAKTGFSDSIKFGDITEILQDDGLALDVDLSDPAQAPANPYWRMVVLDEYHDGGFRLSAAMRSFAFRNERTGATLRPIGGGPRGAPTWTFYLEAGVSRYLPSIGRFDQLRFREAQNYRYSSELGIVSLRDEPASMTPYRLEGMASEMAELPDPAYARRIGGHGPKGGPPAQVDLKGLSAGDQQVLARMVSALGLSASQGTGVFSRRAIAWLRQLHPYSLSPSIPDGPGDPLIRWMSSREPGHCELFAGALVLIARSAGIPARVVTGFKGGTWNAYSGNYTIRNSDAHAWAELWDPQRGAWLREDPLATSADTAASEGAAALAGLMDRSWSARLNSLRVFWYRRIVNFDQQTQADTFRAFKAATDTSGKWLRSLVDGVATGVRRWVARPWDAARVARTALAAGGGAAGAWILYAAAWRIMAMGQGRRVDPVRREAGRWLRRVAGPPALVADLQRLRYGPVPTWPRPAEVFRTARRAGARRG